MWQATENGLHKIFLFKNFSQAFTFMTACAFEAERLNHHPQWSNVYNRVEVYLNTHDAGKQVTDKDYELARVMDTMYELFQ